MRTFMGALSGLYRISMMRRSPGLRALPLPFPFPFPLPLPSAAYARTPTSGELPANTCARWRRSTLRGGAACTWPPPLSRARRTKFALDASSSSGRRLHSASARPRPPDGACSSCFSASFLAREARLRVTDWRRLRLLLVPTRAGEPPTLQAQMVRSRLALRTWPLRGCATSWTRGSSWRPLISRTNSKETEDQTMMLLSCDPLHTSSPTWARETTAAVWPAIFFTCRPRLSTMLIVLSREQLHTCSRVATMSCTGCRCASTTAAIVLWTTSKATMLWLVASQRTPASWS
mmetsp:Transcript_4452/g.15633  ORF Transcript_4452/g.15633 Transcript_4452/m.15633 type:complete len:290 (+) Transcript_4452:306-1175(+)